MATNKFATMIHKNTNKITLVLIYAVLEWTLIILLLLNSLFSFLIIKFSQLFALKPPCFWCSSLHRFFDPQNVNLHRNLLCEVHSKEVSVLGFCPYHNKLAEIKDLCEDCFSSHLGFQSEVKQSDGEDEDEKKLKCSCCGNVLESSKERDLVMRVERKMGLDGEIGSALMEESPKIEMNVDGKDVWKSYSCGIETCLNQIEERGDSVSGFVPQDLEFFFDFSGNQLVPIELVDSEESQNISEADQDHEFGDYQKPHVIQEHQTPGLESMELEETENSIILHANFSEFKERSAIVEELQETTMETKTLDPNAHLVDEESEVSMEAKVPVLESCVQESSTNSHDLHLMIENGLESKSLSENLNENEDETVPDTPASITKIFMFEGKESWAEELLDGSLMSEMEGGDPVNTTEKLKLALRALKAELEEERSASAIAASETMAMITRLQEEKAAMQMEALQYQRMMEEQSEYDQEALQLLNELMIKKEKELEMYRKKVADYEAKERMWFSQDSLLNGTYSSSASSSHSEDGNVMKIETIHEWNGNQESGVLELDSSLAEFEEERLSIFEQIKVLEEKLLALSDEEDQCFADMRPVEDLYEENGLHSNDMVTKSNGFHSNDKEKESNEFHSNELENRTRRMDIEEEVVRVCERLQALEADREFLKHCIGSLKKGEKGMELLQEILQHLRDLRTTDFQT